MKKICAFLLLVVFCVVLTGCSKDIKTQMAGSVSDVRYHIFAGRTQNVSASLMCGVRENPYAYNGISNKTCEFGVITLNFQGDFSEGLSFELKVDDYKISGVLEENPYDHNFMTDIKKIINPEQTVYLTVEGVVNDLLLPCVSKDWNVQYTSVLDIAFENIQEDLALFLENNHFKAECYIKIIHDLSSEEYPYYWYFGIIGENGNKLSLIIDPQTGEIITKNIN